jgi:hypothetical protein
MEAAAYTAGVLPRAASQHVRSGRLHTTLERKSNTIIVHRSSPVENPHDQPESLSELPYDSVRDFAPIVLGGAAYVLVVHPRRMRQRAVPPPPAWAEEPAQVTMCYLAQTI